MSRASIDDMMRTLISLLALTAVAGCGGTPLSQHSTTPDSKCAGEAAAVAAAVAKDARASAIQEKPIATIAQPTAEPSAPPPSVAPPQPTPIDALGGKLELVAVAREVVDALSNDRVLARGRLGTVGRARLTELVMQQLFASFGAMVDNEPIDESEILWTVRPTHAEFVAASAAIDKVLERRGIDEERRASLGHLLFGIESEQSFEVMRMEALMQRASIGLSCDERQLTSAPLENDFHRIVKGCGKTAIYEYSPDDAPAAWQRQPRP
jgi:hypothetical protein